MNPKIYLHAHFFYSIDKYFSVNRNETKPDQCQASCIIPTSIVCM
jgi:hypothetical protein